MRLPILFMASVYALAVSLAVPCPKSLRLYFAANLIYTAGTQPFLFFFGRTSGAYEAAYYGFATLHLLGALNMVRTEWRRQWHLAMGVLATVYIVALAFRDIPRPLEHYDIFSMVEGGVLIFAGTALGYSAAHSKITGIFLILSLLWYALAIFRLGFTLNNPSALWLYLNNWLPTVIMACALGACGIMLLRGRTNARSI